jgi:4-amino-4-deoxychorismate lyase
MPSALPTLLETIKCEDGIIDNLFYHQKRLDKSRRELFGFEDPLELSSLLKPPSEGLYRCRVLYSKTIESIQYIPYTPKAFNTLQIVSSSLSYEYKYAERSELESLLSAHPHADDVIIEKNGLITDTTIANLAFFDGKKWVTPEDPLLEGTMRAKLIDEGFLHPEIIRSEEISRYEQVSLINAMLGFKIINPKILHR